RRAPDAHCCQREARTCRVSPRHAPHPKTSRQEATLRGRATSRPSNERSRVRSCHRSDMKSDVVLGLLERDAVDFNPGVPRQHRLDATHADAQRRAGTTTTENALQRDGAMKTVRRKRMRRDNAMKLVGDRDRIDMSAV